MGKAEVDLLTLCLNVLGLYLTVGLVFALWFCFRAVGRVDPMAAEIGFGMRLILVPGATALWPLLVRRMQQVRRTGGEGGGS